MEDIDNLKIIFQVTENSSFNDKTISILNRINNMRKEDKRYNEIQKQVKSLYSFYKISSEPLKNDLLELISKQMSLYLNIDEVQQQIESRIELINKFKAEKTQKYFHSFERASQMIPSKQYQKNFTSFNSLLKTLEIDLFSNDNVNNFWGTMSKQPDVFNFLVNKSLAQARDIYEFIDDAQDESNKTNLSLHDIEALIYMIKFKDELLPKNKTENQTDETLLNKIKDK